MCNTPKPRGHIISVPFLIATGGRIDEPLTNGSLDAGRRKTLSARL